MIGMTEATGVLGGEEAAAEARDLENTVERF